MAGGRAGSRGGERRRHKGRWHKGSKKPTPGQGCGLSVRAGRGYFFPGFVFLGSIRTKRASRPVIRMSAINVRLPSQRTAYRPHAVKKTV